MSTVDTLGRLAGLSPDGASVSYGSVLTSSGARKDAATAVAVDASGQAYVLMRLDNAANSTLGVVKVNAAGTATAYSFTMAGNADDIGQAIAVDAARQVAVAGMTKSTDLGAFLVGGHDQAISGSSDAFVLQLNATGSAVRYGSLFGGTFAESGTGVAYSKAQTGDTHGYLRSIALGFVLLLILVILGGSR